jgi:hypothetical protein
VTYCVADRACVSRGGHLPNLLRDVLNPWPPMTGFKVYIM